MCRYLQTILLCIALSVYAVSKYAIPVYYILHSLLGKPFTLECNQKTSASMYSMTVDMTVGLAEMVECVFDRKGAPASLLGVPIDKTVPDYCEVSTSLRLFCYLHRILKELLTRQDSFGLLTQL